MQLQWPCPVGSEPCEPNQKRKTNPEHSGLLASQGQDQDVQFGHWLVLLKWHTRLKQIVTYPKINIKIIFAGVFDGADEEQLHTTHDDRNHSQLLSQRGRSNDGKNVGKILPNTSGRKRTVVPPPHKETVLAEFSISSQELFSKASFAKYSDITLRSEWQSGSQSGPIELHLACKVARQVSLWPAFYSF